MLHGLGSADAGGCSSRFDRCEWGNNWNSLLKK